MAEDKRKFNGGNSTKSKKGTDKRTNPNKKLLEQYIEQDFDYDKLSKLMKKLYQDALGGDVKSAALFLSYILGKPKETKDIELKLNRNFPDWLDEC
tara:strand:+ start:69 stop:356 length:288 start_codon:yes stop_codon:yes gene_type:complete